MDYVRYEIYETALTIHGAHVLYSFPVKGIRNVIFPDTQRNIGRLVNFVAALRCAIGWRVRSEIESDYNVK